MLMSLPTFGQWRNHRNITPQMLQLDALLTERAEIESKITELKGKKRPDTQKIEALQTKKNTLVARILPLMKLKLSLQESQLDYFAREHSNMDFSGAEDIKGQFTEQQETAHCLWAQNKKDLEAGKDVTQEVIRLDNLFDDILQLLIAVPIRRIARVSNLFEREPVLIEPTGNKILFVGDTHGDLECTKKVCEMSKSVDRVVFLGDYIDRGDSLGNLDFLLEWKLKQPEKVILLRGNHEAFRHFHDLDNPNERYLEDLGYEFPRRLSIVFGKSGQELHKEYLKLFDTFPLMARVDEVFAVHGGPPRIYDLEAIRKIDKNDTKNVYRVVWTDISDKEARESVVSPTELDKFLKAVGCKLLIRSHQPGADDRPYGGQCLTIYTARHMGCGPKTTVALFDRKAKKITEIDIIRNQKREITL